MLINTVINIPSKRAVMKKMFFVLLAAILVSFLIFSYVAHKVRVNFGDDNNISIRVKETEDIYQLNANYRRNQTARLHRYMDARLHTNHLFKNSRMDATVTLDDKTSFYVRSSPGRLLIKLDKNVNDEASYIRIKELAEDIKQTLADN
jgi:hypothetical protein